MKLIQLLPILALAACQAETSQPSTSEATTEPAEALFSGTELTGWQTEGPAQWTVNSGDLQVTPGETPSYLINASEHKDFSITLGVDCPESCAPGLFLRRTPVDNGVRGVQVPLSGSDLGSAYAVGYDAAGQETSREALIGGQIKAQKGDKITIALEGDKITISSSGTSDTGTIPQDIKSGGVVITATAPGVFTLIQPEIMKSH